MEEILKRQKRKSEFKDSFTQSTKYMDWLNSFTEKNGSFSTDSFLYNREGISDVDLENVQDIQYLFEEIYDFCEDNYIEPTEVEYGAYYSIVHNNIGYFIGVDGGQGTSFYCTRLEEPDEDALDINKVRSGVKLPKTVYDEYLLEELEDVMERLYNNGVSISAIKSATEEKLQDIRTRSDEQIRNRTK